MNQLECVLEVTGPPNAAGIAAIKSQFAATMLASLAERPKMDLKRAMKGAPDEAVDLVERLMNFNPEKRPDVEQALKHPYMASFYTGKEPKCPGVLTVPIDDDHKYTVIDYRERLYTQVVTNKKDRGARMAAYFAGAK